MNQLMYTKYRDLNFENPHAIKKLETHLNEDDVSKFERIELSKNTSPPELNYGFKEDLI